MDFLHHSLSIAMVFVLLAVVFGAISVAWSRLIVAGLSENALRSCDLSVFVMSLRACRFVA